MPAPCRAELGGRAPDFVVVADLRRASMRSLSGAYSGAPQATVARKTLGTFWSDAVRAQSMTGPAMAVVNGAFFAPDDNPTGIAFEWPG